MRRPRLVLLGVACLVLAVVLHPSPESDADGVLAAVGRSMGGFRVMVVNALFLRAETQKKAGRIEDAAALYHAVLELDPANEPATIFLVNVILDELVAQAPDPQERYRWWLETRAVLEQAIERRPGSAPLHAEAANVILKAGLPGGVLDERPAAERRSAERQALGHLLQAARRSANLPRLGHTHLVQVALLAPQLAAEALRDRDAAALAEALDACRELERRRGAVLAGMRLKPERPRSFADLLRRGVDAVTATRDALVGTGSRQAARDRVAACRALLPDWNLNHVLEALLDN